HGTVTEDDDGNLVFVPDLDFCGVETLRVTLSDGKGGITTYSVEVTVTCRNDAPVGVDDAVTTQEDRRVVVDPTANDTDPDGPGVRLHVELAAASLHGEVRLQADGQVVYRPKRNF